MAIILNIETATKVCSAAIAIDGTTVQTKEINDSSYSHAENLSVFIDDILKQQQLSYTDLDAVAVSQGPGSYTGLRIGVSTAKGLCYALDIPLISVSTLAAMADGFVKTKNTHNNQLLCPMIDARRMEVYAAIYDYKGSVIRATQADIINELIYKTYYKDNSFLFFGDGASKCQGVFKAIENAIYVPDFYPSAKYMELLSEKKYKEAKFEDTAYFEPFYLKDFIAGKPKKLI